MKKPAIAREGLRLIVPFLALVAVLLLGRFYILASCVLCFTLFCIYFFRDPVRQTDAPPGDLISPADGTVIDIGEAEENEFLDEPATRVAIFMSPADVHVNRAPCAGRVAFMKRKPGNFAMAYKPGVDMENEKNFMLIETVDGKILIVQIAGFLARRIIPYIKVNDHVDRGQPVGIIAFGSRVDIYFHKGYEPVVQLRQKVKAGVTVVARKKVVS